MDLATFGPALEVMSPDALLAKVIRHNTFVMATDTTAVIRTRMVLANGVEVVGQPIGVDPSKNAVVASESGLVYVNVATLSVLELLDLDIAAPLITSEPPPPPAGSTPLVPAGSPQRRELRGELSKLNAKLAQRFRLTVEAEVLDDKSFGDVGKNQFVEFLEMLDNALHEIGSDDVGEITIGSLDTIMIAQAPGDLAVKRSGDLMVIAVPFAEAFDATLAARLHTELQLQL